MVSNIIDNRLVLKVGDQKFQELEGIAQTYKGRLEKITDDSSLVKEIKRIFANHL